jgi:hypothetical protein
MAAFSTRIATAATNGAVVIWNTSLESGKFTSVIVIVALDAFNKQENRLQNKTYGALCVL